MLCTVALADCEIHNCSHTRPRLGILPVFRTELLNRFKLLLLLVLFFFFFFWTEPDETKNVCYIILSIQTKPMMEEKKDVEQKTTDL